MGRQAILLLGSMISILPPERVMYEALVRRDAAFDGVFFVRVTSTGIFCRPSCPARKPRREHVLFCTTAEEALDAGFRPTLDAGFRPSKRCRPMGPEGRFSFFA